MFALSSQKDQILVKLGGKISFAVITELERSFKATNWSGVRTVALDFYQVLTLEFTTYPYFVRMKSYLNAQGIEMTGVRISPSITQQIRSAGLAEVFSATLNQTAANPISSDRRSERQSFIEVKILNICIDQVIKYSNLNLNLLVKNSKAFLKKEPLFEGIGVVGLAPLNSADFYGVMRIIFPMDWVGRLSTWCLNSPAEGLTDEVLVLIEDFVMDLLGEVRSCLQKSGLDVFGGIPSTMIGIPAGWMGEGTREVTLVVPLECEVGRFFLEIALAV